MKRSILLSLFLIISIIFIAGWSTQQRAIVRNTDFRSLTDMIQTIVISNNWTFKYINPDKGLFQIYVKTTTSGGYFQQNKDSSYYVPESDTNWEFSVNLSQVGPDVQIDGSSSGGMFPGKYFKKLITNLQDKGYTVISGKDLDSYNSQTAIEQPQNNFPSDQSYNNPLPAGQPSFQPHFPAPGNMQPPVKQLQEEDFKYIISDINRLETETFNKTSPDFSIDDRLSLLELHYFGKQLVAMSPAARIQAIKNKIKFNSSNN
ncbi:MAG: hypothetical protein AB1782_18570 [Cyanobacteriota bacterium]